MVYVAVVLVVFFGMTCHSIGQIHDSAAVPRAVAGHVALPRVTAPMRSRIPVGLDAYLLWDQWPEQRIGMRAYMRSTYDRAGGNEGADASHFLYQRSKEFNVTLDVEGPGVLVFSRYNHWHGSPWHYVVDGIDHLIQETSSRDPLDPSIDSHFEPEASFPSPLNFTWASTKGADLIWTPVPFESRFQMAYTRTHYGTGYYIFDRFVPDLALTHPLRSWTEPSVPDQRVLDLINRAGSDIAPRSGVERITKAFDLPAGGSAAVAALRGNGTIRAVDFSIPRDQAPEFKYVRLRITWDNRKHPSVDAPIALFYGAGTLYNRDNRTFLVKAFPVNIRFTEDRVYLACYFPMPFSRAARIELVGGRGAIVGIESSVRYTPQHVSLGQASYFHATYRDFPHPVLG